MHYVWNLRSNLGFRSDRDLFTDRAVMWGVQNEKQKMLTTDGWDIKIHSSFLWTVADLKATRLGLNSQTLATRLYHLEKCFGKTWMNKFVKNIMIWLRDFHLIENQIGGNKPGHKSGQGNRQLKGQNYTLQNLWRLFLHGHLT